jgi:hypothetical protein
VATGNQPRDKLARKRAARKRRTTSKIAEAQKSAFQRREERRKEQDEKIAKKVEADKRAKAAGRPETGALGATELRPAQPGTTRMQRSEDKESKGGTDLDEGSIAAVNRKIAGLASVVRTEAIAEKKPRALADPSMFGRSDKAIKDRLASLKNAADESRRTALRKTGSAVFMGPKTVETGHAAGRDGLRFGQTASYEIDNIIDKNHLMAWLADEGRFNDIKARAQQAGIGVESYEDVAKLWQSVLDQAASTYSLTGKKVTPWALMSLRGKQMVKGKPQAKTGVSTTIEEMDPAEARLLFEKAAQEHLGRAATKAEIDDFIAKAQTIAKANPLVQNWRQEVGFDGEAVEDSVEVTSKRGGAEAVNAQAQVAAMDMAKQDEEYGAYQAAGFYGPLLFEALQSPV